MTEHTNTLDLAPLDRILGQYGNQKDAVIPILQNVQEAYGYLPREILTQISKRTGIPEARLIGVATFYAQFRLKPRGKHLIRVCDGTACHVRGAPGIVSAIAAQYDVLPGASSSDYKYTLEVVYCVGACGLAPVIIVNDQVHGNLSPDAAIEALCHIE